MKNKTRNDILKIYSASEAEASARFLSPTKLDQKRRNENRERRLIRVQPKESDKHQHDPVVAHALLLCSLTLVASDEDA